ncbi:uncharacterized protein LOC108252163 [Diaphorina citri]|uniref:Uncharacterized protein LOC108252162 n=1 Tax=Diaphorina citri TaxID=121845 RepID=A0A1S4E9G1_DIACI|nr:uncharacterized protein LOC108252162 [Diaphorina citri]XP_026678064.1 uncharacterized protein LOC108252163 [Diaphorina citri]KAI5729438.1 hypothetical protein M8J76_002562 [Diaphorina citri]KAI5735905.1 hypothetical protein M8J77_024094 [Diaphorina citri]
MLASNSFLITLPSLMLCFLSIQVPDTEAINCFVCNSRKDPYCEYLRRNDTQAKEFSVKCNDSLKTGERPFCRKIVQYIKDYDEHRVIRKCGYQKSPKECYTSFDDDHEQLVCQCFEDGCNSSSSTSVSIVILTLSSLGAAAKTLFL